MGWFSRLQLGSETGPDCERKNIAPAFSEASFRGGHAPPARPTGFELAPAKDLDPGRKYTAIIPPLNRLGQCLALWAALAAPAAHAAAPIRGALEPVASVEADYLRSNRQALPKSGTPAQLPPGFLDEPGPRFFLLGEVHGVATNNDVDLTLLKFFQRTAKIRTYVSEISYAHSWYLNRFLRTGNEAPLDRVFEQLRGRTVDASREKRGFWEAMRRWNLSLPPRDRIGIAGIDLERFPGITLSFLREELEGSAAVPRNLRTAAAGLLRLTADAAPAELKEAADNLGAAIDKARAECSAAFGDEALFGIEQAIRNLRDRDRAAPGHGDFDRIRDRAIYDNFLALSGRLPAGSLYGRIGFAHVAQHAYQGKHWLSYFLNRPPSRWAGRVVGIWPLYRQSRRLAILNHHTGAIDCSDDSILTEPFGRAAESDITLFKLTGSDSLFSRHLFIPGGADGGVTTDYFQYVVLMNNASAATPWPPPPGG